MRNGDYGTKSSHLVRRDTRPLLFDSDYPARYLMNDTLVSRLAVNTDVLVALP